VNEVCHSGNVLFVLGRLYIVIRRFIGTSYVQNAALVRACVTVREVQLQSPLVQVYADITKLLLCRLDNYLPVTDTFLNSKYNTVWLFCVISVVIINR